MTVSDRQIEKLRERLDVLLQLSASEYHPAWYLRWLAGLENQHMNVTLGHLRKLRDDGLACHNERLGWCLEFPAGSAAREFLLLTMHGKAS